MNLMIVDGQGGGIGRAVIEELRKQLPNLELLAVGTNASATASMVKAGAHQGATGENAIIWNAQHADIIVAPIGAYFANSLAGEISPKMAEALACSPAEKIAIPVSRCHIHIMGIETIQLKEQIAQTVSFIQNYTEKV